MEKHFKAQVMRDIEFVVYDYFWACESQFQRDFIFKVLSGTNRINCRGGLRARVQATRMSGEMNTSLGNGLSNLLVFAYIVHKKGGEFDGLVEGDDGLFVSSVKITTQDYANLGFDVKVKRVRDPLRASFCGIVCTPDLEIIVDPKRKFQTLPFSHSYLGCGYAKRMQLLKAKALSLAYEAGQCPVVGALARYALSLCGEETTPIYDNSYHMAPGNFVIPEFQPKIGTRLLFQELNDIDVPTQLYLEKEILKGRLDSLALHFRAPDQMQWYVARYAA